MLVTGASGAAGMMALQLARKLIGPTGIIVGTCSTSKIDFVKGLGADEVNNGKCTFKSLRFRCLGL